MKPFNSSCTQDEVDSFVSSVEISACMKKAGAMALGWCRSQRLVLCRIESIKRRDILNMEKTRPSFEDGRKVLSDRAPLAIK